MLLPIILFFAVLAAAFDGLSRGLLTALRMRAPGDEFQTWHLWLKIAAVTPAYDGGAGLSGQVLTAWVPDIHGNQSWADSLATNSSLIVMRLTFTPVYFLSYLLGFPFGLAVLPVRILSSRVRAATAPSSVKAMRALFEDLNCLSDGQQMEFILFTLAERQSLLVGALRDIGLDGNARLVDALAWTRTDDMNAFPDLEKAASLLDTASEAARRMGSTQMGGGRVARIAAEASRDAARVEMSARQNVGLADVPVTSEAEAAGDACQATIVAFSELWPRGRPRAASKDDTVARLAAWLKAQVSAPATTGT